jgi:hypothetical protein
MDYVYEAQSILYAHCEGVMSCATIEFENNRDMLEFMTQECAYILTERLLEGKYTPMQYNAIRNELSALLWGIFEPHIIKEDQDEIIKLYSL